MVTNGCEDDLDWIRSGTEQERSSKRWWSKFMIGQQRRLGQNERQSRLICGTKRSTNPRRDLSECNTFVVHPRGVTSFSYPHRFCQTDLEVLQDRLLSIRSMGSQLKAADSPTCASIGILFLDPTPPHQPEAQSHPSSSIYLYLGSSAPCRRNSSFPPHGIESRASARGMVKLSYPLTRGNCRHSANCRSLAGGQFSTNILE